MSRAWQEPKRDMSFLARCLTAKQAGGDGTEACCG